MTREGQLGYESSYYINTGTYDSPTWTAVNAVRDVTAGSPPDEIDMTTREQAQSKYAVTGYGLKKTSWAFDVLRPTPSETATAYDALVAANDDLTTVDVLRVEGGVISTDGLDAVRMVANVFGGEKSDPIGADATVRFELKPAKNDDQDVPADGTTSSSEFVASS